MDSTLQLWGSSAPHPHNMATRQLLEQYMLHAAALFSQIESTRQRLASLELEHHTVLKAIADVQSHLDSGINRLPTELLSKVFEFVSEDQDGAVVRLSHVCSHWRRIALSSPRAWSKVTADISPRSDDPRVQRALAYLARSGACPIDVQLIASAVDTYDPSNGVMDALSSTIPRWRSFTFQSSNSGISSDVIKSLSGCAPALEEFRLAFQPGPRAHSEHPRVPANFMVQAPSLRVLQLNGVGVNLSWVATLPRLQTLELVQNSGSPLPYNDLLHALSKCATSLRHLKVQATISNTGGVSEFSAQAPLNLPCLQTLDLILQTTPVASLLIDIEAPNLESLSLQDVRIPSDRWCSPGLRAFLRQPASRLRQLRLCSLGLEDDELAWAWARMPVLESLEMIHLTNTDAVLRTLSQPMPDTTSETWVIPALHSLTVEQCHQITGTALVDCIKSRNTRSLDSATHTPIRQLRIQNCYQFERRHSVKLSKLTPLLNLDIAVVSSFSFGLGGMRARSPFENTIGVSLPY